MAYVPLKRARDLIIKPENKWTENDKEFMKAYAEFSKRNKVDDGHGNPALLGLLIGSLF